LQNQVEFLNSSITTVLALYKAPQPLSVVLVAHSIGGIIARGLFLHDHFDPSSVSIILTLASPNLAPVVSVDYKMACFYQEINTFWKLNTDKLSNISVLSVSGGYNDLQVHHYLTKLPMKLPNHLSTSLNAISHVQLTTDHQAMVWCRQMVLVTSRFLFSLLDQHTGQVTNDIEKRKLLMQYYFGSHHQTISSSLKLSLRTKLHSGYLRKAVTEMIWTEVTQQLNKGMYYAFDVIHYLNQNGTDFVAEISARHKKWILVCQYDCSDAVDLSLHAINNGNLQRLRIPLDLLHEHNFSTILIHIPKNSPVNYIKVNVAIRDEYVVITVPHVLSNVWKLGCGFNHSLYGQNQIYYRVHLNGFSNVYQSFDVAVYDSLANLEFAPSWDQGMSLNGSNKIHIKIGSTPSSDDVAVLHVYTNATNPKLAICANFVSTLAQLCRHFYGCLLGLMIANILLTYSFIIKQWDHGKDDIQLKEAHFVAAKPYKVVPFVSLIHVLFQYEWFSDIWCSFGLPIPDTMLLQNEHRIWFGLCPLIFFFFAYELVAVEFKLQKGFNFLLIKIMKHFTVNYCQFIFNAKYWRIGTHVLVMSLLIPVNYTLVYIYIYFASVVNTCYMTVIEDVTRKCNGNKSNKLQKQMKTSLRIVTSQLWFWLSFFNLPSLIFAVARLVNVFL